MNKFGNAAAMSYALSIVCFMLTLLYIRLFMGKGEEQTDKPGKPDRLAKKIRRSGL
jgi:hypothetical protein